jgi:hypothetical protein
MTARQSPTTKFIDTWNNMAIGQPKGYVIVILFVISAHVLGCGSKATTYPARGNVRYPDGTPLTNGWVTFRSQDHDRPITARGLIQPDGTFTLKTFKADDGAVAGRHQALVTATLVEGDLTLPLDPRFSSFETSGLEFQVTDNPAQNQFEIVVTPPSKN